MKESDFISILEAQGWICGKDGVGDSFCLFGAGGLEVQIIPSVAVRSDHFRVSLAPSVSIKEFSDVVNFIFGGARGHVPIISNKEPPEKLAALSSDDVQRLSTRVISWARSQSIEAGLTAYRSLPTDAKGAMPLRHLAALAITGDLGRLEDYKKSFETGDRLGFVPYIAADMIDRAVLIAQKKGWEWQS